jgi:hypothetical protein
VSSGAATSRKMAHTKLQAARNEIAILEDIIAEKLATVSLH